ncbi:hypothetical protein AB6A40_003168 [Gnathostoma spinigerum]|uniref:Hemimethylated DNA-binding domain-containing protein n=1 Tax=Gnathostoma spinigerum TaxID=75299 RepID=A0ABD6EGJ4_9BILA
MVETTTVVIFVMILLAVPLQFYLSPSSSSDIRYHFHRLMHSISDLLNSISGQSEGDEDVDPETLSEGKEDDYFGSSTKVRDPRPPHVIYHVGDVVRHKILGYRGVIIGWDETAKAPKSWIEERHRGRKDWTEKPNYAVIIDTRDRLTPQFAYIVQENLELSEGKIFHPLIKVYFEYYDGKRYVVRPWHHKIYPNG